MAASERDEQTATSTTATDLHTPAQRSVLVFWRDGLLTFELPVRGRVVIGRSQDCDIPIDHISVSRRHAALEIDEHGVWLEDLTSANGTVLSGRRISPRHREAVARGAVIEVGMATLVVQGSEAVPAAVGHPAPPRPETPLEATMARIVRLIALVAGSRISVLLLGETGVGKEVMAEQIHQLSPRAGKPLVRINCAAMPEPLLESELFGYERGAFTGATQAKIGLMEAADGGTVFLDEVAELPAATQAKLLRVLESREVMPIGSLKPRPIDVRFIAATNRDLEALAANGAFREDLFYRLNGMAITIPPLRDRRGEIPTLARELVARLCREANRSAVEITDRAMSALTAAPWPGNIRELRNVLERALVLSQGATIDVGHLPANLLAPSADRSSQPSAAEPAAGRPPDLKADVERLERQRIVEALDKCAGNQTKAAELLGISRRTLVGRLDAYHLARPRKKT